ncbi:MAG: phosphate/phosphite/phosphonate ABC transporter substrate-binding protein [Gammaproteobacteria bacterium]
MLFPSARRIALQTISRIFALTVLVSSVTVSAEGLPSTSSRAIYGDQTSERRLVIGSVTNAPKYNFGQMKPISLYMLDQVQELGIDAVMVVTTDTHEQMIELLRDGYVDWVAATPYAALMYEREASAEFILTKKSHGRGAYRSVFFARNDSNIKSLDDLKGKTIAFEKPGSTSAYFLPAMELLGAGYELVRLGSPRDSAPDHAIGFLFSGDEVNSSTWVHKRIADAAAFSNEDWESDWRTPKGFRPDLAIFHETDEVPRSLEVVRSDLDPFLRSRIANSLLKLNSNPDAREILSGYYGGSGFSQLTPDQLEALEKIRKVIKVFNVSMTAADEALRSVPKT